MSLLKIDYHAKAAKFLQKQEKKTAIRIVSAINKLPDGDTKKLEGYTNKYRLRVGSVRIIFSAQDDFDETTQHIIKIIKIWDIDNRGDIY